MDSNYKELDKSGIPYLQPLNHSFLKTIENKYFPINIEKRIADFTYNIVIRKDYVVALHYFNQTFIFSNMDVVSLSSLDEAVCLMYEGKLDCDGNSLLSYLRTGKLNEQMESYIKKLPNNLTEEEINQEYVRFKASKEWKKLVDKPLPKRVELPKQEQVMDKEYMDVLEYCKLYSKKDAINYTLEPRNPVKQWLRVIFYENEGYWESCKLDGSYHGKSLKYTTLKEIIDYLDSWF